MQFYTLMMDSVRDLQKGTEILIMEFDCLGMKMSNVSLEIKAESNFHLEYGGVEQNVIFALEFLCKWQIG